MGSHKPVAIELMTKSYLIAFVALLLLGCQSNLRELPLSTPTPNGAVREYLHQCVIQWLGAHDGLEVGVIGDLDHGCLVIGRSKRAVSVDLRLIEDQAWTPIDPSEFKSRATAMQLGPIGVDGEQLTRTRAAVGNYFLLLVGCENAGPGEQHKIQLATLDDATATANELASLAMASSMVALVANQLDWAEFADQWMLIRQIDGLSDEQRALVARTIDGAIAARDLAAQNSEELLIDDRSIPRGLLDNGRLIVFPLYPSSDESRALFAWLSLASSEQRTSLFPELGESRECTSRIRSHVLSRVAIAFGKFLRIRLLSVDDLMATMAKIMVQRDFK